MPIDSPQIVQVDGLVWSVAGPPTFARTRIKLLKQGRFRQCLIRHPQLMSNAHDLLLGQLIVNCPVDLGRLRNSIKRESWGVSLGPRAYNRAKALAERAGRVYKRRKRNIKLARNYALHANVTSTSKPPGFIEESIKQASKELIPLCLRLEAIDVDMDRLDLAITTRPQPDRRRPAQQGTPFRRR